MEFRLINAPLLDRQKYDAAITTDPYYPIYICGWYLDTAAASWGALVGGDYELVLPLAFGKKAGFNYIYQPFFTRNTGIFGSLNDQAAVIKALQQCAGHIKYWDFNIECSYFRNEEMKTEERLFQQLDLSQEYESIYKKYAGNLKRSIRDASNAGITIRTSADVEGFVKSFRQHTSSRIPEFGDSAYQRLEKILSACMQHSPCRFLSAYKNDQEVASAFFAKGNRRIIYIEGFSSPEGRKLQAMHLLFDAVIKAESGSGNRLDFGGSTIPSIAHFFHAFGGEDVRYVHILNDQLPPLIRFLKKLKGR